jgi:hypothetical protein
MGAWQRQGARSSEFNVADGQRIRNAASKRFKNAARQRSAARSLLSLRSRSVETATSAGRFHVSGDGTVWKKRR